jgi:hypothetical protein
MTNKTVQLDSSLKTLQARVSEGSESGEQVFAALLGAIDLRRRKLKPRVFTPVMDEKSS